jgi:two-component system NtrC family sensor kinase
MLGYSDLLLSTALTPRQQPLADKIGQDVRRTRSLVASLISFARQSRPTRTPLDLNTLARTAVKLTQSQWESLNITVQTEFDPQLPRVLGDSNQLLQVCLQLLGHCFDATDVTRSILTVRTEHKAGKSELLVATGLAEAAAGDSPSIAENSLGLSACQGIVQEHGGKISAERTPSGAVLLRVELPGLEPAPLRAKESTVPVRWPSRPFV